MSARGIRDKMCWRFQAQPSFHGALCVNNGFIAHVLIHHEEEAHDTRAQQSPFLVTLTEQKKDRPAGVEMLHRSPRAA